ncbi:MAG: YceD family protein [Limisphaerales bacterium]
MSLRVNLRHLEAHGIHLKGELPVKELDFSLQDEMMAPEEPLSYDLRVEKIAQGILAQGKLALTLHCQCVRCLKPFNRKITLDHWTLHLSLEGGEAASVDNDCVDLTPYAREDMLLEFPQHPLCAPDCPGLGESRRENGQSSPSAWNELDKLNF